MRTGRGARSSSVFGTVPTCMPAFTNGAICRGGSNRPMIPNTSGSIRRGDDCELVQSRQTSGSAAATELYLETSPPSLRTSLLQASDLLVFGQLGRLQP